MPVKLNHYWSIAPGMNDEYLKFIVNKFIPGVNSLGLHTVAVWSVLIGAYSEIVMENACNDLETIEKALKTDKYKSLKTDLFKYVTHYMTKILVKTGRVDSYSMDIRKDTIKFNQMWDVQARKMDEYVEFVTQNYFPTLEELGVTVAGEWEVLLGDGPVMICEGRVTDIDNLLRNLQSKKFQKAKNQLKQYIYSYRSRILTFHVQKLKGYKSESYQVITDH